LLDPIHLLVVFVSDWYDKVWYPGVVIEDVSLRSITCWEGDSFSIAVQSFFEVRYFIGEGEGSQHVLLFSFMDHGGEALGNVEDGDRVVLVELYHSFGRARGDGLCRSRRGPNGGRRANGCLNQSVDGDGRHASRSVGVMVGTRVVFAEPSVDEGVVRRLVVDPQKEELSRLEVGLKLEDGDFKWDGIGREGF
jgi:hypothetical protein